MRQYCVPVTAIRHGYRPTPDYLSGACYEDTGELKTAVRFHFHGRGVVSLR